MKSHACLCCQRPDRQKGVSLILALLIVAAVGAMAVYMNRDVERGLRFAENRQFGAQGMQLFDGGEEAASFYLNEDLKDNQVDNLGEPWAQPYSFPLEIAVVQLAMEDMQGRLNINNLQGKVADSNGKPLHERFTVPQRRFIRLLQSFEELPVDQNEAVEITEAVIDWLDPDDEATGFGGAESSYYQSAATPGYRPANREMLSVSELRLVKGVTAELFQLVAPHLCALPAGTPLNVNTANAHVLRTLNISDQLAPLSQEDGDEMVSKRGQSGYDDMDAFLDTALLSDLLDRATRAGQFLSTDELSVSTGYFMLRTEAVVAQRRSYGQSLLHRTADGVRVVNRQLGSWQ
ncbi:type II secretion system minor pseudopilin GspK [Porticoccus sp. W117]|uniref:type II secretion system minor pseudopilin GspK n=1 Tax=Porticoccus sp. W117 TaxID=3054777 RepID=UPI0025969C8B|nr:type II secretion system minor pseudopilin GspK [Porticoccus sp. W117]MDM3869757.1 type II secretion system minor pseudopilin GspK [Porticoccus sp. W117]